MGAVEDASASSNDGSEAEVSEAQIAVHWREEEYFNPPAEFIAQANANDPAILERFSEENFPECFKEYADLLDVGPLLAHDARHEQSAVLEVVRRRPPERVGQLR